MHAAGPIASSKSDMNCLAERRRFRRQRVARTINLLRLFAFAIFLLLVDCIDQFRFIHGGQHSCDDRSVKYGSLTGNRLRLVS